MARLELKTPAGASIEVKELTTADRIELCGDEEQLKKWLLDQDHIEAYRPHIERACQKATATEDKNVPGRPSRTNNAYDWLYTTADYFLTCSEPQGFPWGDNLVEVWFNAPLGRVDGVPDFWTYGVLQSRHAARIAETQAKN